MEIIPEDIFARIAYIGNDIRVRISRDARFPIKYYSLAGSGIKHVVCRVFCVYTLQ